MSSIMSSHDRQIAFLQIFEHIGFPVKPVGARKDAEPVDVIIQLQGLGTLPKGAIFSTFNSEHMAEAKRLYDVLKNAKNFDEFLSLALSARETVNESLLVFAVSRATMDCSACRGLLLPPIEEIFPDKFIPAETLNKAIMIYLTDINVREITISIDETSILRNPEHRLAYFREDIGINSHHWHWHLVFPYDGPPKDRKGELFYYMHQQLCARYDCERLSVGLRRTEPFHDFDDILEGYSPHLKSLENGTHNGSRPDGLFLKNVNRISRWYERIMEAIHQGYLFNKEGNKIYLDDKNGIVVLGDMIESSNESPNREYYGDFHNEFHNMLAQVHDPKEIFKELPGVIGEPTTAVRDPIFFRLHRFVDDLFNEHKISLPAYEMGKLHFPGIEVLGIKVINKGHTNIIFTHMEISTLELNHAIPIKPSIKVRYQHLNHDPFSYEIEVKNKRTVPITATVRIFLGPTYDETGKPFFLNEQRRNFLELDKFWSELMPGQNIIKRNSSESSVTRENLASFNEIRDKSLPEEPGNNITDPYCSCGWPQNMLIPRGTYRGMDFKLFVMLTDHDDDSVTLSAGTEACGDSSSYCGVKDEKYPDEKPMGFPFDRFIPDNIKIDDFLTENMSTADIKIKFLGLRLEPTLP